MCNMSVTTFLCSWLTVIALRCLISTHFTVAKQTEPETQTSERSWIARHCKLLPSGQVIVFLVRTFVKMGCMFFQYDFILETKLKSLKQVKKCLWLPDWPCSAGNFLSWSHFTVSNHCSHPALQPVHRVHPFYLHFYSYSKMHFYTLESSRVHVETRKGSTDLWGRWREKS